MIIRKSTMEDLDDMLRIYSYARQFMAEHGNPRQWGEINWPPQELIINDIRDGDSYVCTHEGRVVGTFYFIKGKDIDPTYNVMDGGSWQGDDTYGVVHRMAGDGSVKGIGACCLNWAFEQCANLRVDTHEDNIVLQNLLKSLGFQRRGIIYVLEDKYPRIAYEKF